MEDNHLIEMTADIVGAHVSNSKIDAGQVPGLIVSVHAALTSLGKEPAEPEERRPEPAVSVRKSLANKDRIISMIDGRPYSALKRHLTAHGYTPESYRAAFNLPADYPMVAPGYSETRRELAKKIGLGRKPGQRRGRRKVST